MSRFNKWMILPGLALATSFVFAACSDEDFPENTMGSVPVNSCVATTTSVNLVWSIVSNGNCDGYEVAIIEGTDKGGTVVTSKEFDARTCQATFDGLKPNTTYLARTFAKPSASSGRTEGEYYYKQFTTAPYTTIATIGEVVWSPDTAASWKVDTVLGKYVKDVIAKGTVKVTWDSIPHTNCGGYSVTLEKLKADGSGYDVVTTQNIVKPDSVFLYFDKQCDNNETYRVGIAPVANAFCFYTGTSQRNYNLEPFKATGAPTYNQVIGDDIEE